MGQALPFKDLGNIPQIMIVKSRGVIGSDVIAKYSCTLNSPWENRVVSLRAIDVSHR